MGTDDILLLNTTSGNPTKLENKQNAIHFVSTSDVKTAIAEHVL